MTTASRMALSSTQWMVDWVHRVPTNMRSSTTPSLTTRFPDPNIFMVEVPNLPDGSETPRHNKPRLTRRQT
jgi:hypothetical protein|tara:strand:- start:18 stop:230 length:213 start_codon:yes stop_codon:yes gene_type:complete